MAAGLDSADELPSGGVHEADVEGVGAEQRHLGWQVETDSDGLVRERDDPLVARH